MNKLRASLLILLSIILMEPMGGGLFAQSNAGGAYASAEGGTHIASTPTRSRPEDVGMSSATLSQIDRIVTDAIAKRVFPGCQVLVLKEGKPIYDRCFGGYTYESVQKVQPTTLYDLASLSKTTGTLLAIMKLYDNGMIQLTDRASTYLSFLKGTDKEDITINDLLFHESGLPASLPFYKLAIERKGTPPLLASPANTTCTASQKMVVNPYFRFRNDWVSKLPSAAYPLQVSDSLFVSDSLHTAAMRLVARTTLRSKTYLYSCVNFILLKEIAETISGTKMDTFLNREFYRPMQLNSITYLPLRSHKKDEVAPTLKKDFLRNGLLQGYVHDPDAAILGGVSGNAGLFATSHDVAMVYQMLLNRGELDGKRYLSEKTCNLFTTTASPSGRRWLGYDRSIPTNPKHSPCCSSAPAEVYGHTGYTGTCCWVDPINKLVFVFLSNRTYPNDGVNQLSKMRIRTKIQEVIYQSMR